MPFPAPVSDSSHHMGLVSRVGAPCPALPHRACTPQAPPAAARPRQQSGSSTGGMSPYASSAHRMGFGAIIEEEEAQGEMGAPAFGEAGAGGAVLSQPQGPSRVVGSRWPCPQPPVTGAAQRRHGEWVPGVRPRCACGFGRPGPGMGSLTWS